MGSRLLVWIAGTNFKRRVKKILTYTTSKRRKKIRADIFRDMSTARFLSSKDCFVC